MSTIHNHTGHVHSTTHTHQTRDLAPLTERPLSDVMPTPSAQEVSALNNYYSNVLDDVDSVRNLGCTCPQFYEDAGAGQAIENQKANNPNGPIGAEEIYRLIKSATDDLDGSAAGKEFNDLQKFVEKNWDRMDAKAQQVWTIYYQQVMQERSQGNSGIKHEDYEGMLGRMREAGGIEDCDEDDEHEHEEFKDASSAAAIEALDRQNPEGQISGDQMMRLIFDATQDGDSQAAGKEYDDLAKFVQKNYGRLSAEAKEIWDIYAQEVEEIRAQGQTGIPGDRYGAMLGKMREVQGENDEDAENFEDVGAGDAIGSIGRSNPNGQVSGAEMRRLILDATKDFDGQSAGAEYNDLKRYVDANNDRLSPDAREIWEIYQGYAEQARAQGQSAIPEESYQRMMQEMKDALG